MQSNEAARESEWSLRVERERERISLRWLEESGKKHLGIYVKSVCAIERRNEMLKGKYPSWSKEKKAGN